MRLASLTERLTALFARAFEDCGLEPGFGRVEVSQRPDLGQFQCNGALAAAKTARKKPADVAQAVLDAIKDRSPFADLSLAGPGFINITLSDAYLAAHANAMASSKRLGCPQAAAPLHVVIDYGGPNVAKPMHVGHLRSTIIGESLKRLFRFLGHRVTADIHLGDWGLQMGMLIHELGLRRPDLPYFDPAFTGPYPTEPPVSIEDLQEMYPAASARCKADPALMEAARLATVELQKLRPGYLALWRHFVDISICELRRDLLTLGVEFDLWRGESHYNARIPAMVEELRAQGHVAQSDDALVIEVSGPEDKKPVPPLILVKSDGGYLYATTDLATILERTKELRADLVIYVVDKRQHLHFEQVFRAARRASFAPPQGLEHIAFGTMNGPDGKPFKTRAGGVMHLKDLISLVTDKARARLDESGLASGYGPEEREAIAAKVGLAALKYADLSNHRLTDYAFDLDAFCRFEGRTGPYIQYTAVRIKSILRKAADQGLAPGTIILPASQAERGLMLTLGKLPDRLMDAYAERAPHHLCEFSYDLAQSFSQFYMQCHILSEKDASLQASWLSLSALSLDALHLVCGLLGIDIPERM